MASLPYHQPPVHAPPIPPDHEPDAQWKRELRHWIEGELASMVKKVQDDQIKGTSLDGSSVQENYDKTMNNLRYMAEEQYKFALEKERQQRRSFAVQTMDKQWEEMIIKEQQEVEKFASVLNQLPEQTAESNYPGIEPDAQWKTERRHRIEGELAAKIERVKTDQICASLDRPLVQENYDKAMNNLHNMVEQQYQFSLEKERIARRWYVRKNSVKKQWEEVIAKEQQEMASLPDQFPVQTAPSNSPDLEPDARWKKEFRHRIKDELASMVKKVKDDQIKGASLDDSSVQENYDKAMNNLRNMAEEQYQFALEKERQKRRLFAGQTIDKQWEEVIVKEMQEMRL